MCRDLCQQPSIHNTTQSSQPVVQALGHPSSLLLLPVLLPSHFTTEPWATSSGKLPLTPFFIVAKFVLAKALFHMTGSETWGNGDVELIAPRQCSQAWGKGGLGGAVRNNPSGYRTGDFKGLRQPHFGGGV